MNSKNNTVKKRVPAKDVDDYLAAIPEEARVALEKLRKTIHAIVPEATEVISYQIPTFRYHGSLVGFAAFPNHCSFFLMSTAVMDAHKHELLAYDTTKATIHFKADKPLPATLVKKLVQARIEENEAAMSRRKTKRAGK